MRTDPIHDQCFYIIGWVFLVLTAGLAIALHLGALNHLVLPPCTFHRLTGFYCPGCGGTRALFALLRGHPLQSLYYHPIVGYAAVFGGWFMLSQTIERLSHGHLKIGMHYRDIYLWIALAIVLVNFLVKNLVLALNGTALLS